MQAKTKNTTKQQVARYISMDVNSFYRGVREVLGKVKGMITKQ
jgi:hypothetical protein